MIADFKSYTAMKISVIELAERKIKLRGCCKECQHEWRKARTQPERHPQL